MARSKAGSRWDAVFLGPSSYQTVAPAPVTVAYENASERSRQPINGVQFQDSRALAKARAGDEGELLPYQPTPTINPGRPRTLAAGYDPATMTLHVKFRDGDTYGYRNVPPSVWWRFQRAQSPGRFINSTLNRYPYVREIER